VGVNVGRLNVDLRAKLAPVVQQSCVVPVFFGTDPSPAAGVYVGVIRGRGVVLTCLHAAKHGVRAVSSVVAGVTPIEIYRDRHGYDMVAVLVPPLDVPAATVGTAPPPGDMVEIVGYPLGRFGRHRGKVLGYFRAETGRRWGDLSIDTASQDGDSGGAVLDSGGVLVGLLWGTRADGAAGSVAISAPAIANFLARLEITLGGSGTPPGPDEPGPPVPPVPAPNCDDLLALIEQNAQAIAALAAAAKVPGPPGVLDPAALTDEQVAALRLRLGHVRIPTVKLGGTIIAETSAPLGVERIFKEP